MAVRRGNDAHGRLAVIFVDGHYTKGFRFRADHADKRISVYARNSTSCLRCRYRCPVLMRHVESPLH